MERADWESVRKRTDWNLQIIKWLVHQTRPCLRAKVSAVKLKAIGPEEKDRELDVLHLEQVTYTSTTGTKKGGSQPNYISVVDHSVNFDTKHYSLSRFVKEISHLSKKIPRVQKYRTLGGRDTLETTSNRKKKFLVFHCGLNPI